MEEGIKDSGEEIFLMEKENKPGQMAVHTKEHTLKEKKMASAFTKCEMVISIKVHGKTIFSREKVL